MMEASDSSATGSHSPQKLYGESPTVGLSLSTSDDDESSASSDSDLSEIISKIIEVESAVLGKASSQDVLRQISLLKLRLLLQDFGSNSPSYSQPTSPRCLGSSISLSSPLKSPQSLSARREHRSASLTPGTRRKKVSTFLDRYSIPEVPNLEISLDDDDPDQVSALQSSSDSVAGADESYSRNGQKRQSNDDPQDDPTNHQRSGKVSCREPPRDAESVAYEPDFKVGDRSRTPSASSTIWEVFANVVTFPIHDSCVLKRGIGAKKAWREKVAIFFLFLLISGIFVSAVSLVPLFVCTDSEEYYDMDQVAENRWTSVFGKVYDLEDFIDVHPGGSAVIRNYRGYDASRLFARLPPTELPSYCLSNHLNASVFNETNSLGLQNIACLPPSAEEKLRYGDDGACHTTVVGREHMDELLGHYHTGDLVIPEWVLGPSGLPDGTQYIVIDQSIYNVTKYLDQLKLSTLNVDSNHSSYEYGFLSAPLHNMVLSKTNGDATELFYGMFPNAADQEAGLDCLNELFYHARVDDRYSAQCARISTAQYALAGILGFFIFVQVSCSLAYIARRPPMVRDEDKRAAVMIMVPCYNESDRELRKTIDSVLANDYPNENKVLVVVADGVITGRGEKKSCPETLAAILGFQFRAHDPAQAYQSTGAKTMNYATVYPGTYTSTKHPGKELKYIVVVKQGSDEEQGTGRAGNRGKRDSQLLLFGILNRLQYNRRPTDLDRMFMSAIRRLGVALEDVEYLLAIDADTRVSKDALKFFVHKMDKDKSVLACCGETRVDNKSQSFTTMIQVFEYYSAHHLKKAFESVFGCVTCLPGCFTMYRLYTEELQPLLACDNIFRAYSRNDISSLHERNLYELGEDRMLTTLMLQEFHAMQLSFVPEATCWTIVPHTFQILKSQRRRWINSTLHNMCELLKVETMCGVCFFSMKMVVLFDLLSTFLLPSGCVYLYYIVVEAIRNDQEPLSPLQMVAFAYVGVMTLPFVVRAQWDYFIWFFVFLVGGIPVFYFYLPIYAFWHMDDLSWGKTRQVQQTTTTATTTTETVTSKQGENERVARGGGEMMKSSNRQNIITGHLVVVESTKRVIDPKKKEPPGTNLLLGECPRTIRVGSDEPCRTSSRRDMSMMAEF